MYRMVVLISNNKAATALLVFFGISFSLCFVLAFKACLLLSYYLENVIQDTFSSRLQDEETIWWDAGCEKTPERHPIDTVRLKEIVLLIVAVFSYLSMLHYLMCIDLRVVVHVVTTLHTCLCKTICGKHWVLLEKQNISEHVWCSFFLYYYFILWPVCCVSCSTRRSTETYIDSVQVVLT